MMTDGDAATKFHWESHNIAESIITITWDIPQDAVAGVYYRIRTFGKSKDIIGTLKPYIGTSRSFLISR